MKWFKLLDIGIQVMLTIVAVVIFNDKSFALFYFGLGGWQVFSCLVHLAVYRHTERSRSRRKYEKVLAVVLGTAAGAGVLAYLDFEPAVYFLYAEALVMVVGGMGMAAWYFGNCIVETRNLFDAEHSTQ